MIEKVNYWVEWRHKCRKKARRKLANSTLKLNFSDLELRSLEISGDTSMTTNIPELKTDNDEEDDSDSIPLDSVKSHTPPIKLKKRRSTSKMMGIHVEEDNASLPPKWALDMEERRIAAQERMAEALESIASIMRSQDERRIFAEDRLTETLTEITGTVHDINGQVQVVVEHLQRKNSVQSNGPDIKTVFI